MDVGAPVYMDDRRKRKGFVGACVDFSARSIVPTRVLRQAIATERCKVMEYLRHNVCNWTKSSPNDES